MNDIPSEFTDQNPSTIPWAGTVGELAEHLAKLPSDLPLDYAVALLVFGSTGEQRLCLDDPDDWPTEYDDDDADDIDTNPNSPA